MTAATVIAVLFGLAYLALCAYGIHQTGSTAGLADIGHALVAVLVGVVIWLSSR